MSILPVRPRHDFLFIDIIDRNVTTKDLGGGKVLHLLSDDSFGPQGPHNSIEARHPGVRPRWARVLEIGPEVEDNIKVGDLVLCDTLKWGHGVPYGRVGLEVVYFWRINVKDILVIDDAASSEEYLGQYREMLAHTEIAVGHL